MLAKVVLEIVLNPGHCFYSRLFLVGKTTGGWRPVISLSPERACSSNSIQDGDSCFGVALRPRGRFPSLRGFEGRVFSNTRSSVLAKAIAFHVGGDILPVQGPVLRTVDCPPGLYPSVCSRVIVSALSRDSTSTVPERLAGPCLLGGSGQATHPRAAVALSLSGDCDK